MFEIARAKGMLPAMPDEVFDEWLAPLIKSDGWPFFTEFSIPTGVWSQYLDGHSIQSIKRLNWKRGQIIRNFYSFCQESRNIIRWIIDQHLHGVATPVARIKNGKGGESFFRSREFIERTGRLYAPVILIKETFGYKVMDGNHRVAALFAVRRNILAFDVWTGE